MSSLPNLYRVWREYWFGPVEASRIAQTRSMVGVAAGILFFGLVFVGPKWFTDEGWLDSNAGLFLIGQGVSRNDIGTDYRWSPFYAYPQTVIPAAIAGLVACVALVAGKWPQIAAFLAFICLAFFHHRAPLLATRCEPLLSAALFYLILVPNRVNLRNWNEWHGLGFRLLQVHFAIWIGFSFLSMLGNEGWWTGQSVQHLIRSNQGLIPSSWSHPWLVEILTHVVLVSQAVILIAIFNPTLRSFGIWANLVFVVAIILVIADWLYALSLLATATSVWHLPFLKSKQPAVLS